jgi:polyisoprenoid-binding protein YceI
MLKTQILRETPVYIIDSAMKKTLVALLVMVLLSACQSVSQPRPGDWQTRAGGEETLTLPEGQVFEVASTSSDLRIVAYPDGALARFGHPHVIGGQVISGQVVLSEPFHTSGLSLSIDVTKLEVDHPDWRRDEGFDPQLSESAIDGTLENLRSVRVLNVEQYPNMRIESTGISGPSWQPDIGLRITLVGQARELTVPVALVIDDDQLTATGQMLLRQSDFGIEPFSAAGGSLQVADEILVRFRIVARLK